jgi:TPR repeat protein
MLVRLLCTFLVLVFAICTGVDRSFADTRVALVIGNGAYQNAPRLPNPTNDAAGVAAALKRAGFDTILATDLSKAGMDEATIRFARAARTADVAMFYYSGHALQFAGVNYLAPVDIDLRDETDLRRMTRVDDVVADLAKARNLRILVLDSCRDNPLAEQLKRSIGASRALPLQRGLAKIDSPEGMIVAYATQAGRTADDGDGKNSPYTTAFLKHIDEKEEIGSIFRRISADVYETTKHEQLPELSLSLIGEFYLHGKVEVTIKPEDTTLRDFDAAAAVDTVTGWDAFLTLHPEGFYATLARERRTKAAAKIAAPPIPPSPPVTSSYAPSQQQEAMLTKPTDPLRRDLVTDCDRLAAHPFDAQRPPEVAGVFMSKIDGVPALRACNDAMRQYPGVARFAYQAGRAALVQDDYAAARERLEQANDMGNKAAADVLGLLYEKGLGVSQDYTKARQWYEKAAAAGMPAAMYQLGLFYQNGQGVTQDYALARQWCEKAAAAGEPAALVNLGFLYQNGLGGTRDYALARQWYEKGAAAGVPLGMSNLGLFYHNGLGVSQDYTQARQWYEKAAAGGEPVAMNNLGILYEGGLGVAQDYTQARQWYEKAAAAGNEQAKKNLQTLQAKK